MLQTNCLLEAASRFGCFGWNSFLSAVSQPYRTSSHAAAHERHLQRVKSPSLLLCTAQKGLGDLPDLGTVGQRAPSPASPLLRQIQSELRVTAPQPGHLLAHPRAK